MTDDEAIMHLGEFVMWAVQEVARQRQEGRDMTARAKVWFDAVERAKVALAASKN